MKQSVKRTLDTLSALGFRQEPHPYKPAASIHWHVNEPETRLTVWAGMSDAAASKVIKHAEVIVGLAHTETDKVAEKAKRESAAKKRDAAERQRQLDASKRIAAQKDAAIQEVRRRQYATRQLRGQLTQSDRLTVLQAVRGEWIDPLRIADELCIKESDVRTAINNERLDAYMHPGKRVLCKVRDVREWVKSGCPTQDAA